MAAVTALAPTPLSCCRPRVQPPTCCHCLPSPVTEHPVRIILPACKSGLEHRAGAEIYNCVQQGDEHGSLHSATLYWVPKASAVCILAAFVLYAKPPVPQQLPSNCGPTPAAQREKLQHELLICHTSRQSLVFPLICPIPAAYYLLPIIYCHHLPHSTQEGHTRSVAQLMP